VINGLNVVTSHDISDNQIATAIRESMKRMVGFDIENITIAVEKGIVFLTGKVPHWNAFYSAENVAKNTRGVIDVRNELLLF
jgi:osmotically-inducible protein OsmY